MIKVTIELIPHGDPSATTTIGEVIISNTLSHPNRPISGNYLGSFDFTGDHEAYYHLFVNDYDRNLPIWFLLKEFFNEATRFLEENPHCVR